MASVLKSGVTVIDLTVDDPDEHVSKMGFFQWGFNFLISLNIIKAQIINTLTNIPIKVFFYCNSDYHFKSFRFVYTPNVLSLIL